MKLILVCLITVLCLIASSTAMRAFYYRHIYFLTYTIQIKIIKILLISSH